MMASGETQWAELLVRGIDPKVLARVRRDAARRSLAVSDFIRMILCRHYGLECAPSKRSARPSKGSTTILLRPHPHLKYELEQDSEMRKLSQAAVVRQILEARYARKKAA
jgi:hypothetical protein